MEQLINEFVVNRPLEEAWAVLTDLERIAPCMPGAKLDEVEGDTYMGSVKVKLGAITAAFKGSARFKECDDAAHRAVLLAEGRETGGKGNADALITARLHSTGPQTSVCTVATDLRISGRMAQFGRGILGDVSKKLMDQFAANLNALLEQESPVDPVAVAKTPAAAGAVTPVPESEVRAKPAASSQEAVNLGALVGPTLAKRLLPLVIVVAIAIWLLVR